MLSHYRLPPDLQADLTWYWCEEESELGVVSNAASTIATIQRRARPSPFDNMTLEQANALEDEFAVVRGKASRERLQRWRQASPEERRRMRDERHAREDAELEREFYELHPSESYGSPAPTSSLLRSPAARERSARVGASIRRLSRGWTVRTEKSLDLVQTSTPPADVDGLVVSGAAHERVLFRVYGDPLLALRQDELANLADYAKTVTARRALLSDASRAYAAANEIEREARRAERRRAFDAARGKRPSDPPPRVAA